MHETLHAVIRHTGDSDDLSHHGKMANDYVIPLANYFLEKYSGIDEFDALALAAGGVSPNLAQTLDTYKTFIVNGIPISTTPGVLNDKWQQYRYANEAGTKACTN